VTSRYTVIVRPHARKQFLALDPPVRRRVGAVIDALALDPLPPGARKLADAADLWRIRAGDYRVVYTIC
jgi:mRNA interferase RelE/StbE